MEMDEEVPLPPGQAPRTGIWIGSAGALIVVALVVLVVLAIGYFTVISVFGVPWYAAVPLSLVAGAGIIVWEMSSSWKAWLIAGALVALAALSAIGWWTLG